MVEMALEEVGTEGVKKIDKKSKEKSKKGISVAVEVGGNRSDEAHMTKDGTNDVCKSSVKTISRKGDKENKKTKKKKVKDGSRTEESNYHFVERDANGCGKESEIRMQNNHDGSLIKTIGGKKKEKGENSGVSDDKLQHSLDIIEGINMTTNGPDVLQNGIDDSAVGQGSDSIVVMSAHKKTKKKSKKSYGNFGLGSGNKEMTLLTKQEIFEKRNRQGESVEPFGEGHTFESVEKEEKMNKRKRKKDKCIEQEIFQKSNQPGVSVEAFSESHILESVEKEEKRKQKRKKSEGIVSEGNMQGRDLLDPKGKRPSTFDERDNNELLTETTIDTTAQSDVATKDVKKRTKKSKKGKGESGSGANTTMDLELDGHFNEGTKAKKGKVGSDDEGSKDPKPKKNKKKVSFSGKDEVFQLPEDNLVRGKRFSKEEDEMVKEAVFNYIETNCLGEEGLKMVLNCKSYPKIRSCWKEIGTALPHRPQSAVYYRAQILFRRDEKRKWTKEEIEILRVSHKKHGNQWRAVADELGKHRVHVKDTWRRIRHANLKKGRWSQDEYQTLFDLVNLDLRMKYAEEKKSKYGMLRDNVPWTAISDRLTTRAEPNCCFKWYNQLTSPMVMDGDWVDSDDYRLIDALFQLDANCYEDVDWDNLLEHRPGTICQKRWSEMVLHIGDNVKMSFANQVEVLAKRYCPELLEARESWESKPVVS